jgi:hypothetical protein
MRIALFFVLVLAAAAAAQPRQDDAAREQAFIEALRREDPAAADRYVELRDRRAQALAELRKVETQASVIGAGMREVYAGPLRQARHKYAEAALAMLDFYDERDRTAVARYQEEIGKISGFLEERKKARAELEKLRAP